MNHVYLLTSCFLSVSVIGCEFFRLVFVGGEMCVYLHGYVLHGIYNLKHLLYLDLIVLYNIDY